MYCYACGKYIYATDASEQVLRMRLEISAIQRANCGTEVPNVFENGAALHFFELKRAPQSVMHQISKYSLAGENCSL